MAGPCSIPAADISARVVAEAQAWVGTPYHHQQSVKGVGCDCLGLVRGVWREVIGPEPEAPPAYSRDWAESSGRETLLEACRRWLVPVWWRDLRDGDVIVMQMARGAVAKHCGIFTDGGRFAHAREGVGVIEQNLAEFLRSVRTARIVGGFRFPGA